MSSKDETPDMVGAKGSGNNEGENESFEEHYRKLEGLSNDLQQQKVTIDELIPRMKEALQSIRVCKGVLAKTKSQLVQIQAEFEELDSKEL